MFFHRIEKALEPAIPHAVFRPPNVRDPFAADTQQVFGGQLSRRIIVGTDKVGRHVFELAIQQDQRRVALLYLAQRLRARLARGDNQRIQPVRQHVLDLLPLQLRILFRGRDHQEITLLAKGQREAFCYICKKRMNKIGNDQSDQVRSPGNQAPRGQIRPVAELFGFKKNALAGRFADIRVFAQRLRDRHYGDAKVTRNVLHLHGHTRNYTQSPANRIPLHSGAVLTGTICAPGFRGFCDRRDRLTRSPRKGNSPRLPDHRRRATILQCESAFY